MKPTTTFFVFLLLCTTMVFSQNREVVVTRGFENHAEFIDTLPGKQWVFVTQSSPAAGAIYLDTITLWITDSLGRILQSITVPPALPFERYTIYDLMSLRDTSMLLIYAGGDCDACCYKALIEKWNADGSFAWRLDVPEELAWPYAVSSVSPSLLYILSGRTVMEVDVHTGQIVNTYGYGPFNNPHEAVLVHGTRDVIAYYYGDSVAYYKFDSLVSPGYTLVKSRQLEFLLSNMTASDDGNIYAKVSGNRKVIRMTTDLDSSPVADFPVNGRDFTITDNGVITLTKGDNRYYLHQFDLNGQHQFSYQIEHPQLEAFHITSGHQSLGVIGAYRANEKSMESWFRSYKLDSLVDHAAVYSVAIVDIDQQSPIVYDSVYINQFNYVGYLDNIRGGNFRMQVQNTGDQPVESFRINYHLGNDWFYWWCGLDQVKNVQYQIQLDPGESTWVEFGNVESNNMFSVPEQLCFWTSAPSNRPDDAYLDDRLCTSWYVPTLDIGKNSIDIHPNPAEDVIILSGLSNLEEGVISVYSIDGKKWLEENLQQRDTNMTINTTSLPSGYYILRSGSAAAPVVIQREKQ